MKLIPELTIKDLQKLWQNIRIGTFDECFIWLKNTDIDGYGRITLKRKSYRVTRVIYKAMWNIDPGVLMVLHSCDNPICCNPLHLRLGTAADNAKDRDLRNRTAKGSRSGAKTHPEKWKRGDSHWTHQNPERVAKGSENGFALLTEEMVKAIRQERANLKTSYKELAKKYGVSYSTISCIIRKISWKHVM